MKNTIFIKSSITADYYRSLLESGKYHKTGEVIRNSNSDRIGRPMPVAVAGKGKTVVSGSGVMSIRKTVLVADDRLFRWKLCRAISVDGKSRYIVAVPTAIRQVKKDSINYTMPAIRIIAERIASVKQKKEYTVEQALAGFGFDF